MHVVEIDERTIVLEQITAVYYVQVYDPPCGRGGQWSVVTYQLTDAEVDEALQWAREACSGGQIFSLAVSTPQAPSEVIWLIGTDPNSSLPEGPERFARMISRAE